MVIMDSPFSDSGCNCSSCSLDSEATEEEGRKTIGAETLQKRGRLEINGRSDPNLTGTQTQYFAKTSKPHQIDQKHINRNKPSKLDLSSSPCTTGASSCPSAHGFSSTASQSSSASDWAAPSQPQAQTLAPAPAHTALCSSDQPRLASDHDSNSSIMDPGNESDLSDVNEELISEFIKAEADTVAKQQQPRLRSPGDPGTALVNGSEADRGVNSNDSPELSFEGNEKRNKQSRPHRKKSPKTLPKTRDELRNGQRFRGMPAVTGSRSQDVTAQSGYQPEMRTRMKITKKNLWSNPRTPAYDIKRVLMSEECLAPDHLCRRPTAAFRYITSEGRLCDAPQYNWEQSREKRKIVTSHPKYAAYLKTWALKEHKEAMQYWNFTPKEYDYPLAGKSESSEVRDLNVMISSDTEDGLTNAPLQEEAFNARPSIRLPVPDHIKAILVDDWENVTKNQQLVPLPAIHTVDSILNDYVAFESPKRQAGTNQAELLQEVVMGLKEYFEKCLGRILLYRFERQQYLEVREGWNAADGELKGLSAVTTYGAEHFCRLLVSLPELLAQTNMDQQSCNRLCEELAKLTIWLGRNAFTYFRSEYETPGPSYIDKARNG